MQCATLSHSHLTVSLLLLGATLFSVGCAGPALTTRIVQEEPTRFVRLDSLGIAGESSVHNDHPVDWTVGELSDILSRLLIEDRGGLLDSVQTPWPVFSLEEIAFLGPAIKNSFERALPNEWVAFYLTTPRSDDLALTSGGIFISQSQMHMVLANHHTILSKESDDLAEVRKNPFHSVKGIGGILSFESLRYVLRRQSNWAGGHRASASELILDHRGFLELLSRTNLVATASPSEEGLSLALAPAITNQGEFKPEIDHHKEILQLQEEIGRLKRKVAEQEAEISRLKRHR